MWPDSKYQMTPLAVAIAAILAGASPQIQAQETDDDDVLEEIVVTASRREQNILDVPYNITAVSGEEIANSITLDNAELLRLPYSTPSV